MSVEQSTPVDGDIIADVARENGMGAGMLKGHLEMGVSEDTRDEVADAVEEAYRRQAERDGLDWGDRDDAPSTEPEARDEWCTCDQPEDGAYVNTIYDGPGARCDCGIGKQHIHCLKCGGVTQVG